MKELYGKEWRIYIDKEYEKWKIGNPEPKVTMIFGVGILGHEKHKQWCKDWLSEFKRHGLMWGKSNN